MESDEGFSLQPKEFNRDEPDRGHCCFGHISTRVHRRSDSSGETREDHVSVAAKGAQAWRLASHLAVIRLERCRVEKLAS